LATIGRRDHAPVADVTRDVARPAARRLTGATFDEGLALGGEEIGGLQIIQDAGDTPCIRVVARRACARTLSVDCWLRFASRRLAIDLRVGAGSGHRKQDADGDCENGSHDDSPGGVDGCVALMWAQ